MAKKKDIFEDLILPTDEEIKQETKIAKISQSNKDFKIRNPITEARKKQTSEAMKGKTLEELIGKKRAEVGRKLRSIAHKGKKRPPEVGEKIAAVRKAKGSYDGRSMLGKKHKESSKLIQAQKAQIRQELKKKLGLGKNDCVPKDLLQKAYKNNKLD